MEVFTIILSSLITLISPVGLIVDNTIASQLRQQVKSVDDLRVRIDNPPTYQILQGKAHRIRIATRGLKPTEEIRIEALEIESDPIEIDLDKINQAKTWEDYRKSFKQPIQAGIRLVITEGDLNDTLRSPRVQEAVQKILKQWSEGGANRPNYQLIDPEITFSADNRLRIRFRLERIRASGEKAPPSEVDIQVTLKPEGGKIIKLIDLEGTLNDKPISRRFLQGIAEGITNSLNLTNLEALGIIARILQLEIKSGQMNLAAFVRLDRKN